MSKDKYGGNKKADKHLKNGELINSSIRENKKNHRKMDDNELTTGCGIFKEHIQAKEERG